MQAAKILLSTKSAWENNAFDCVSSFIKKIAFLLVVISSGTLVIPAAELRTNQIMIGGEIVNGTVSNGVIIGDRWIVVSNKLYRIHAEVTPLKDPPGENSKDSEPALRLMANTGYDQQRTSRWHGKVHFLHGLFYMARGLNTLNLTGMSPVDVLSTEDKAITVVLVRDNGPIYSSTNFGMTWTIIDTPGTYEIPLSNGYFAQATLHFSSENRTPINPPSTNWYAIGSASNGNKLVISGNSPVLSIKYLANSVILAWPANLTGFKVQQNSDLATSNWIDVTNIVNIIGEENRVIISPAVSNNFYRLTSKSP